MPLIIVPFAAFAALLFFTGLTCDCAGVGPYPILNMGENSTPHLERTAPIDAFTEEGAANFVVSAERDQVKTGLAQQR